MKQVCLEECEEVCESCLESIVNQFMAHDFLKWLLWINSNYMNS